MTVKPLNVTQSGNQRIFVGLGWDPNETPSFHDKVSSLIGRKDLHHDLDLSCYYFNQDKDYLGHVGADSAHASNESGSIYHSGDDAEGIGDGDDEQISVELKNLPANIHHIIFTASIKSGHHFGEIEAPLIRLCDGYTDRVFQEYALKDDGGHNAFVFVRVSKTDAGWCSQEISDFCNNAKAEEFSESLSRYL